MKIIILLFTICSLMCSSKLYAEADTTQTAKIYVIREAGYMGSGINFRVLVNDSIYCKVPNKSYSIFYMNPGEYTFYISTWSEGKHAKRRGLKLQLEAGKAYYLLMITQRKFMDISFYLEEITINSAAPLLEKYKQSIN